MQLIIRASDQVLARYGNQLAALGEGKARTALSRALNHEGDKGRTVEDEESIRLRRRNGVRTGKRLAGKLHEPFERERAKAGCGKSARPV